MDLVTTLLFLIPLILVVTVLTYLIVVFAQEALETRRADHIGRNGTGVTPTNYWGRYQESADNGDQSMHVTNHG